MTYFFLLGIGLFSTAAYATLTPAQEAAKEKLTQCYIGKGNTTDAGCLAQFNHEWSLTVATPVPTPFPHRHPNSDTDDNADADANSDANRNDSVGSESRRVFREMILAGRDPVSCYAISGPTATPASDPFAVVATNGVPTQNPVVQTNLLAQLLIGLLQQKEDQALPLFDLLELYLTKKKSD